MLHIKILHYIDSLRERLFPKIADIIDLYYKLIR